jgi:hypothetical protein
MAEREFDMVDTERVLNSGAVHGPVEYSMQHDHWKYCVVAKIDGVCLEIVVAIDCAEDFDDSPQAVLVTGFWSREGSHEGKRVKER